MNSTSVYPHSTWNILSHHLEKFGISHIFGMVGDGIGLLEAAAKRGVINVVTARDQRAAASMALGYAQRTQQCAVYVSSPGPGICNATSAILETWSGANPMLILSSGVSRRQAGQGAFQEVDAVNLLRPITKWAYRVEDASLLQWALHRAVGLAINGRPGPVFLEIPSDLVDVENEIVDLVPPRTMVFQSAPDDILKLASLLQAAAKPVLVVGGGAKRSGAGDVIEKLAERLGAAIFTTASGRGCINERHKNFVGLVGLYLSPPAEIILSESDLIVFLGSQIEETVQIGCTNYFSAKTLVQIDIDPNIIGKSLPVQFSAAGDIRSTLELVLPSIQISNRTGLAVTISQVKKQQLSLISDDFKNHPVRAAIGLIRDVFKGPLSVVFDNGLNDMWGYFFPVFISDEFCDCITPAEQTGLGLSIGIAIGVSIAKPTDQVIAIVGDGAMAMGQSALWNCGDVPVTYLVVNNGGFGWPQLAQSSDAVDIGCKFHKNTDLEHLSKTIGAYYCKPTSLSELRRELGFIHDIHPRTSAIVELVVDNGIDIPIGVKNNYT